MAPAGGSGTGQNTLEQFAEITSGRALNLYNTFTDSTDFERGFLKWNSNVLEIGTEAGASGGTVRQIAIPLANNSGILRLGGTSSGTTLSVDEDGSLLIRRLNSSTFGVAIGTRGGINPASVTLGLGTHLMFSSVAPPDGDSAVDASFVRSDAGTVRVADGSNTGGASLEFLEQTAPAAGGATSARIFAQDNGSGKTQLMVQFGTGAAQQIAIEP